MTAIFKREFKSYFTSPIGYIFLGIMIFFQGWFFSSMYTAGYPDITYVFNQTYMFVFFLIPVLTMRTLSEDRRQKVDQVLITSPVSIYGIVLGKFFATLAIFMSSYAITLVFQIIIAFQDVTVNWLVYIGNVLGIAFMGSALISLGIFISALTESQIISAVGSFTLTFVIYLLDYLASLVNVGWVTKVVEWISFTGRYNTFVEGVIDYSNAIFFIGFTAIFLFLTVRVLDKRRYS
ncbi:MAG: ABC transporter [Clostridia bacterium]|nr:ABC transporter [Clostridia bacterium]